jgi:hypothetical protein
MNLEVMTETSASLGQGSQLRVRNQWSHLSLLKIYLTWSFGQRTLASIPPFLSLYQTQNWVTFAADEFTYFSLKL